MEQVTEPIKLTKSELKGILAALQIGYKELRQMVEGAKKTRPAIHLSKIKTALEKMDLGRKMTTCACDEPKCAHKRLGLDILETSSLEFIGVVTILHIVYKDTVCFDSLTDYVTNLRQLVQEVTQDKKSK